MTAKKKKNHPKKPKQTHPKKFSGLTGKLFVIMAWEAVDFQTQWLLSDFKFRCSDCLVCPVVKATAKGREKGEFYYRDPLLMKGLLNDRAVSCGIGTIMA